MYEILDLIAYYFPECEGINMDATVTSVLHKSQEELEMLARKKVKHLYLGIESGLDDVLKFMKKIMIWHRHIRQSTGFMKQD